MKKLFTLMAATAIAAQVSAQEVQTVFSAVAKTAWSVPASTTEAEITSDYATITGGKMYVTNEQTSAKDLIKAQSKVVAFSHTNNNTFFKVELDEALAAGDVITTDLFRHKDTEIGVWLSTADARPSECDVAITVESTGTQEWVTGQTYTVTEGDGICGEATFYIYRSAGKSNFFTNFTITREVAEVGPFYAVVGSEELFGTAWNAATTTDYMKAGEDGIYTWTKQNVALSENAELKVIKKDAKEDTEAAAWYPSGDNVTLDGWTKAGNYNVTVTFNPENSAVTATAERIITIESLAIVGDFSENEWDAAQGLAMTQDETKKNIWTLTINDFQAEAKTYEYKATANGVWDDYVLPNGDNATWTAKAATYNLVFTVDTEAHTLTLAAQKQSSVNIGKLYIVGDLTGGWPTEATADDDGWTMAKAMTQDAEDASIWTLTLNKYITVEGEQLQLFYKAAADNAWDFAIPQEGNNDYIFYESGQYNLTFTANVEEKTLTLEAVKEQAPEFAENAIYAWQSPTGYAYEQGGEAASEGNINVANDKYYTIRVSGKNFDASSVTITLNEALKAGDVIAITAFRNKNVADKGSGAKLSFSEDDKTTITIGDGLAFNNINTAEAVAEEYGEPNTIEGIVPEAADGVTSFKMTRSTTSTNLFITKIEIKQFAGYTVAGAYKVGEEDQAAFFGTAWAAGSADNDLIDNGDGTYSKTFTGVEFAEPGTIYYKVAKAHRWTESWGFDNENADYVINEPMTNCTVTFTFNPTEKLDNNYNVKCEVTGTPTAIATVSSNEAPKAIFNLAGQRVQNAQKGLYIINGKKVIK